MSILKSIKEAVQFSKETFGAGYRIARYGKYDMLFTFKQFNGIPIFEGKSDYVWVEGARFAVIRCDKEKVYIFTDTHFESIKDEDIKSFILFHEYAHYKYGHIRPGVKAGKRTLEKEIEADTFAMENTSKETAVKSLQYIYNHMPFGGGKELQNRIDYIKRSC